MHEDQTERRPGDLTDVVVAFDIDNTLLDPDGTAYEQTVSELLDRVVRLGESPVDLVPEGADLVTEATHLMPESDERGFHAFVEG
ncbi:MAG: hypothetical protein IH989_02730, partial [Planctomycetes bacterium]|nr:hypothetical protein [Planctomycetota bacterium]